MVIVSSPVSLNSSLESVELSGLPRALRTASTFMPSLTPRYSFITLTPRGVVRPCPADMTPCAQRAKMLTIQNADATFNIRFMVDSPLRVMCFVFLVLWGLQASSSFEKAEQGNQSD